MIFHFKRGCNRKCLSQFSEYNLPDQLTFKNMQPYLKRFVFKTTFVFIAFFLCLKLNSQALLHHITKAIKTDDPAAIFLHPPESAKPGVLWMWMGSNISKEGITRDLEELKKEGFNRTTMFSLADVTTPWAGEIKKSPTPQIIAWTEPWWQLVRFAAEESKRLRMDFGMFNGAGYEASGGVWITPELSMKELCYSGDTISGGQPVAYPITKAAGSASGSYSLPALQSPNG